jgi:CheY-like chemotaxis protein
MKAVKTILFVENDPVSLTMYQNRLQREGFYIETAQDGLTALRILSQSIPDVVVLDLMLPRFSGGEVFKIMRTDRRLTNVPVVVFSNAAMSEWPQDLSTGPTRCLPKSDSTFPMLLQAIQEMLAAAPVTDIRVSQDTPPPIKSQNRNGQAQAVTASPSAAFEADPTTADVSKGRPEFLQSALAEIPKLRELCLAYIKAPAAEPSHQYLATLHQRVLYFQTAANQNGCDRIALLANVFGTLLSEIIAKPSWATTSALQTMAQAVDCLRLLLNSAETVIPPSPHKSKILAVDDDPVCNHVIVTTLRRANFDPITIESPVAALELLKNGQFDLVLLDVNMPEMTGFQLCEKLRRIPYYKTIPVVFVTAFNNFDNRKQSVLSGGNDFITKPISPLELALKVTIHMLKAQVQRASVPSTDSGADAPDVSKEANPPAPAIPIVASISSRNGALETANVEPPPAPSSHPAPELNMPPLPTEQVPEIENLKLPDTVPSSALQPTTESHTTDVAQTTPESAPEQFEPSPANVSNDAFQLAAAIPAPQFDQSLTPAPAESSIANEFQPVPAAAIPTDMFQRTAEEAAVSASAIPSSTESTVEDAESLMAAAAAAVAELSSFLDAKPTNDFQPASPAESSPTESTAAAISALTSTLTESLTPAPEVAPASTDVSAEPKSATNPESTAQPETSNQPLTVGGPTTASAAMLAAADSHKTDAEIAVTSPATAITGQPEFTAITENDSKPTELTPATPLEPAPTIANDPVKLSKTPVADTVAFESSSALASNAPSPSGSAVQPDFFSTAKPADPSLASAPAISSTQTQSNQVAFEKICIEVAKLMFGENGATEMNLRLVRAALERQKIPQMIHGPTDLSC